MTINLQYFQLGGLGPLFGSSHRLSFLDDKVYMCLQPIEDSIGKAGSPIRACRCSMSNWQVISMARAWA